ncbi:small redox-active disulfide protein 2 [Geosporobacter subterraneus DSM 17957]|uniref:Small redox-active disulfide protein 2 n=1 Tax=Geosporobacter subterraneus DSM 17957 TaxID=1121919 RepID=A0A1M6GEW4_9FIRM|nr:thioredoxin family protein [Geosporobacter subterraneus]SHJ08421.1 small redox-active disulfide protein 2 [Geosporobacter subterraneus DSM 17957]
MLIQVLGPGCKNCKTVEANVREALQALDMEANVEKVTDFSDIINLGVMKTPGLIIDGEIKASGRIPSTEEIKGFLIK